MFSSNLAVPLANVFSLSKNDSPNNQGVEALANAVLDQKSAAGGSKSFRHELTELFQSYDNSNFDPLCAVTQFIDKLFRMPESELSKFAVQPFAENSLIADAFSNPAITILLKNPQKFQAARKHFMSLVQTMLEKIIEAFPEAYRAKIASNSGPFSLLGLKKIFALASILPKNEGIKKLITAA